MKNMALPKVDGKTAQARSGCSVKRCWLYQFGDSVIGIPIFLRVPNSVAMRKYYCLFALLFSSYTWGSGAYHEVIFKYNTEGAKANYVIIPISISPLAPFKSYCDGSIAASWSCEISIVIYPISTNGKRYQGMNALLASDVRMPRVDTIGELVPYMKSLGVFGKSYTGTRSSYFPGGLTGFISCIYHSYNRNAGTGSAAVYDCGPLMPI